WGIGPRGGRHAAAGDVCALHLLNPLGQAKLLVGTADGMVRVFASHAPDFAPPPAPISAVFPRPRLLTAFMALPWASSDPPPPPPHHHLATTTVATSNARMRALQGVHSSSSSAHNSSTYGSDLRPIMATAWNQRSGVLFAGGGGKEVRVWDVAAELCIEEIAVAPTGGVTCISHDGVSGNIFATGSAAGVVRVMDRRVDARAGMVANWREHAPSRICGVAMRPGHTEVVSAAASGEVKFWDLRHRDAVHTIEATHAEDMGGGLRHMLAHEHAHVTLTASASTVKLWNQRGSNIGVVTGAKHTYGSAASYMKSLAGYGPPRRAAAAAAVSVEPGASVAAVAMHTYLPVALMVTDDGRVSYIRPSKGSSSGSSASASSARGSGGGGGSSYPHHPPSLASTRASSIL
ncbi:Target of rapamycin complex 1 subunit kog1, partial [Coemansia sp. RSA 2424]